MARKAFAPELDDTPRRAVMRAAPAVRAASTYEAGSHTRRTAGWNAPTASPNSGIAGNLTTLRDRSRAAVRNDGMAKGAIDHLVTNVIGTGITPLSKADDPQLRKVIQAAWLRWTDQSDADGLLDFYGQQSQVTRGWFEGGECFTRLRVRRPEDGLVVPLQLQVLEPELCPHTTTDLSVTASGNRVRMGIEMNSLGQRVAFWFHPSRTSDPDEIDYGTLRRVPADSVIHLYDPLRPGQLRGLPLLTPALVRLHELDKFDDATLLRQQLQNMFVAFIKRPVVEGDATPIDVLTGQAVTDTDEDRPMVGLEPGITQELAPGEDITFSEPPDVSSTYPDFMRQQLLAVSAATGVPYEVLTGDMSKVNDRTVRVILQEFRRRIQAWQHQIIAFQFCRRVWDAWLTQAVISGALPIPVDQFVQNPEPFARVKWMPQGFPYINPVQDQQAAREAVRDGMTSRAAVVAERGEDVETIDTEQAADNKRADDLGLTYDSDARHGKVKATASAAPPTDPDEADAGNPAAKEAA
jgi:lambda family phage portal protein